MVVLLVEVEILMMMHVFSVVSKSVPVVQQWWGLSSSSSSYSIVIYKQTEIFSFEYFRCS